MALETTGALVKATAHGSRHTHLVVDGQMITLCGFPALYRARWMPERDLCSTCRGVARDLGLVVP